MIRYDDSCIVATFGSKANMVTPQVIQVANSGYQYQYNGKEWQDVLGLNVYLYGYRDYDTAIGRWNVIDQLSEKYHTSSPYTFVQNNPIINREIDGRYFDEKNEKKANKLDLKGKSTGDLRDRVTELRKSSQDVREMRNDGVTEYRYASLNSKEAKSLHLEGPTTTITGRNSNNDNIVTMFTENNVGNQLHETRHGGDVARGNLCFDDEGGYGISHEVSAYRAQYSWGGSLSLYTLDSSTINILDIQGISNSMFGITNRNLLDLGKNPFGVDFSTILNINQIDSNLILNITEVVKINNKNYLSWIYATLK